MEATEQPITNPPEPAATTPDAVLISIGGKKFVLAMVALISCTLMTWFEKIEPGIYSIVMVTIISAYIAGNVYQNVSLTK